jgi:hypothetical protein
VIPGILFGVKQQVRGVDHTLLSGVEVKERLELYLHPPVRAYVASYRMTFTFTFYD